MIQIETAVQQILESETLLCTRYQRLQKSLDEGKITMDYYKSVLYDIKVQAEANKSCLMALAWAEQQLERTGKATEQLQTKEQRIKDWNDILQSVEDRKLFLLFHPQAQLDLYGEIRVTADDFMRPKQAVT
jgi:hypothetical protein